METIVDDNSPLGAYLSGQGRVALDSGSDTSSQSNTPIHLHSFAPHGRPSIIRRQTDPVPLKHWAVVAVSHVRSAYALAVSSTLGKADNERFLEHFRYTMIASQLLNENIGPSRPNSNVYTKPPTLPTTNAPNTLYGTLLSAALALGVIWMLDWSRGKAPGPFEKGRIAILCIGLAVVAVLLYAFTRRQWLKHLRSKAVDATSEFVHNAQAFEASISSVLRLVQEIELVSRGYRISSPLPPITRIENKAEGRKCPRLRRNLQKVFIAAIPALISAIGALRPHVDEDDLDRFLDVYDIRTDDIQDAMSASWADGDDEPETLRDLRMHQYHLSTLRRCLLCDLLSLPATGMKADGPRWQTAVAQMESLSALLSSLTHDISQLLLDEENTFQHLTPNTPTLLSSPTFLGQKSHHHTITTLTFHVRTLQAKLHLLRSDTSRHLSAPASTTPSGSPLPNTIQPSTSIHDQYTAIGDEIRALLQSWERARDSFQEPHHIQAAGHSREGLGILIPDGMDVVLSSLLNTPPSPPLSCSDNDAAENDMPGLHDTGYDEEKQCFEAVAAAVPRQRLGLGMSRDQRIAVMKEEREKVAKVKEKGEVRGELARELRAVVRLRPSGVRKSWGDRGGAGEVARVVTL